ncbi:MAG: hypothetical protein ACT4PU_12440 [Planctomycetota bacterium]
MFGLMDRQGAVVWEVADDVNGLGGEITVLGDVDRDGVADAAVGEWSSFGDFGNAVQIVSGATGSTLRRITYDDIGFGRLMSVSSKTGDGSSTAAGQSPPCLGVGARNQVYIFRLDELLDSSIDPVEVALERPPSGMALLDDLDADGVVDVVVANAFGDVGSYGDASAVSSATGEVLWTAQVPGQNRVQIVRQLGDLDSDGIVDVATGSSGSVFVLSGATGHVLARHSGGASFGSNAWGGVDVTGDGVADYCVSEPHIEGKSTGVVHVLDGANHRPWAQLEGGYGFGSFIDAADDHNGDGIADLVVGWNKAGGARIALYSGGGAICGDLWAPYDTWWPIQCLAVLESGAPATLIVGYGIRLSSEDDGASYLLRAVVSAQD